jgi:hypothetical protein
MLRAELLVKENIEFAPECYAFQATVSWLVRPGGTAILGEILDQTVHRAEFGAIDDKPALPARNDESGVPELVQME